MKIIVYSRPQCPFCKKLKTWFRRRQLKFDDRDLTEESSWRDEHLQKTGQMGHPVTEINGEIIIGFDIPALEKAVATARRSSLAAQ
jgi:glutaredoxin 3